MGILAYIILFSLIGGIFSLIGGVVLLWKEFFAKKISIYLLSFAAGTLLAAVFFDLLPEALEIAEGLEINVFLYVLLGFTVFFLIENLFFKVHHHISSGNNHETEHKMLDTAPNLLLIGDSVHNFLDGVAITAAFLVNIPLGVTTALVVAAHEIPQEIGDFSVMLHAAWKKRKIIVWNTLSALMTTVGALAAFGLRGFIEPAIPHLLALTSGLFIYIAATDLLPEIGHTTNKKHLAISVLVFLLGILTVWFAAGFE